MSFQEKICKAFCAEVRVNRFSGGFGVSTPFRNQYGDMLGYYVLGPDPQGLYRIIDNALTVELFEGAGATLDSQTRLSAFNEVLASYAASYDEDEGEISINNVLPQDLERACLNFMALLLRLEDMYFLTQERTENTFIEDFERRLEKLSVSGFHFERKAVVSTSLADVEADFVLRKHGAPAPVALFLASQSEKLWQAMYLKSEAENVSQNVSVVAVLQKLTTGTDKLRAKASNRLDAVTNWEGDEDAAFGRVLRELDISQRALH